MIADYLGTSVDDYGIIINYMLAFKQTFTVTSKVVFTNQENLIQLWDHVAKWTRSIEIKYRNNEKDSVILTRVYFPFNPTVCLKIFTFLVFLFPFRKS